MKTTSATMVLLDIPDRGGYFKAEGYAISAEGVRQMLADYRAKKISRCQLGE